jgi:hypothetical protein
MSVKYLVLESSIILNYDGKRVLVPSGDRRYEGVLEAIRAKDFDSIPAIVEVERGFEGSAIELRDGILYDGDEPLPTELNDRILKYKDLRLDYDSLLNFWEKLKKNPSFKARQMLFHFLSHNGHPITEEGDFIAYRGVTQDFKDKHTGKFDNSPGAVCEMERRQVDDDPNKTCSAGLHVASFDYARDFGPRLVEVKVNPEDVVCVPVDYDGTKMRTCKFEVVQECAAIREELVYGKADTKPVTETDDDEQEEEECEAEDGECIVCGFENEPGSKFCNDCGSDDIA